MFHNRLNFLNVVAQATKRAAIIAIAVTISVASHAQTKGDMATGGNLVIGTGNSYTNIGIGAKFLYNVTDPIRLGGEFDFFPKKDYTSWWDFSVYGHYLFSVADRVNVFPSVGLGLVGARVSFPDLFGYGGGSYSSSWFALSLGGGADIALSDNLFLTGELRLKIFENSTRINLTFGVAYKF